MLAGAADAPKFLDHVVGALMGLCGTVFAFISRLDARLHELLITED
jgi:hypothetical protein